jgi:hypothetical protein
MYVAEGANAFCLSVKTVHQLFHVRGFIMSEDKSSTSKRSIKKAANDTEASKPVKAASKVAADKPASAPSAAKTSVAKTATKRAVKVDVPAEAAPAPVKKVATKMAATKTAATKTVDKDVAVATPAKKAVSKSSPAEPSAETRKKSPAVKKLVDKPAAPSAEERQRWIATAAYHRAEKRGFAPGYEVQDWLDAEAEISALVGKA